MRFGPRLLLAAAAAFPAARVAGSDLVLASEGSAAPFVLEGGTDPAIVRACDDVRGDVARIAGVRPDLLAALPAGAGSTVVIAGVVGRSVLLDRLAASGKLDLGGLRGSWETFVTAVVPHPFAGVDQALVIAGSDRRGTIYGLYAISEMIGVSPWEWWADVTPIRRRQILIPEGTRKTGPPSVKYRGIFLNDEDWGLRPWVGRTFDPATGNFGPKTYAKVFELLLRLRANTLWPAMHPGSRPFNADPENARLADAYGIVMGSSHAEPMLRNNVGEWKAPPEDYNYLTHPDKVRAYWEERMRTNGRFENIYTLGMRGIHDSGMVGPKTDPERIRTLERIFADQRRMIADHVDPQVDRVPQMFCAYKEVLPLYREGLRVPADVTIVETDDNFGYVRNFTRPAERSRPGGFGVYNHVSYLGSPLSYLWLCSTPPALIWEEMAKAYDCGANRFWMLNVGDLKPAEIDIEFFLRLAWDERAWGPDAQPRFLHDWAAREFGPANAEAVASVLAEYYHLNFQRKPEQLQWWLPREPRRPSPLTDAEVTARLADFARLRRQVAEIEPSIPAERLDAYFELVTYPVEGSALANERYFQGERGNRAAAFAADRELRDLTARYNQGVAGGKWRGILALEPADGQWKSFRIEPWSPPDRPRPPVPEPPPGSMTSIDAAGYAANRPQGNFRWTVVPGLGRSAKAAAVLPSTLPPIPLARAEAEAPRLDYDLDISSAGGFSLAMHLLPTHPLDGAELALAIALDGGPPKRVALAEDDGGPAWALGVLDGERVLSTPLAIPTTGRHRLSVYALDGSVVLDRLVLRRTAASP